jgi:phage gpG-like protein
MTPTITIKIPQAATREIAKLLDVAAVGQAIAAGMDEVNQRVVRNIKERISGPGVNRGGPRPQGANIGVDSGTLRRSIGASEAVVIGTARHLRVVSAVGSNVQFEADSVVYAWIHEYGGDIHRSALPKPGHKRGRKYVITIPPRPYLQPEVIAAVPDYGRTIGRNILNRVAP